MKSKVGIILGVILVVLLGYILMRPTAAKTIQVNNELCPVSGKAVNGSDTYVHKGKEYNLCSDECKQPLSEHPEQYLPE